MFVNRKAPARAASVPEPPAGRRVPLQERSKRRVARILDAAALVFAEEGFDAATMEAIAARAETSVGSIYQFFPNKLAVFNELARRYRETLRGLLDAMLAAPLLERPWSEILEVAVDALAAFHESEPAFRAVWVSLHLTDQVVSEGEALNRELAKRLEAVLERKLDRLPAKERPLVATMLVEVMTGMLILSARRGPDEGKAIMAQTKTLLRRYLAPYDSAGRSEPEKGGLRSHR
jgi:AcrR family transcriptional regulator